MNEKPVMKEIAKSIIVSLVDYPDEINIHETSEGKTIKLWVEADKADVGKIIGKKGQNIKALRTLLKAIAAKNHQQSLLMGVQGDILQ